MKKTILFTTAIIAFFLCHSLQAQSEGMGDNCTSVISNGGHVTLTNRCAFSIHYYLIPYNAPTRHFNNYLNPGESANFDDVNLTGDFKWYACDSRYYAVGQDGRVIDHLVQNYRCVKK